MQFSLEMVSEVARLLQHADLAEISLEADADSAQPTRLTVRRVPTATPRPATRPTPPATSSAAAPPVAQVEAISPAEDTVEPVVPETTRVTVRATAVGLFRECAPPRRIGDRVSAGQAVGSVESLKIPTEILAPADGTIEEVLVEEGQGVEYNQPLVIISQ